MISYLSSAQRTFFYYIISKIAFITFLTGALMSTGKIYNVWLYIETNNTLIYCKDLNDCSIVELIFWNNLNIVLLNYIKRLVNASTERNVIIRNFIISSLLSYIFWKLTIICLIVSTWECFPFSISKSMESNS